ncbi:DUF3850 domain-containing protein [Lactobacillus plantarum]|uniref:ASCH/PUA domain-containing protein n=1 Tax=Lactiplantibacillus plantarum TaxID=1590 RepID=UPI00143D4F46|nr:ASCH/PUA domain-containing protein [Lactiplantibacillus plantarum]MBE1727413.1 DUF3850 domain-containing protein [Lactiplantibacillus plantarum]NKI39438.1 DUF3850 domain-containing protein [Lactiplantibacillus plantarum]
MTPKVHDLKIAPKYMAAQIAGIKNFEIRKNDRDFEVGDQLRLREWADGGYTGNELSVYVTYITDYQQQSGYVVLGTKSLRKTSENLLQVAAALA